MSYVAPQLRHASFHCSRCNVFAHQEWFTPQHQQKNQHGQPEFVNVPSLMVNRCVHCGKYSYWIEDKLRFPDVTGAPMPHPDTPDAIKEDYEEARSVFARSPRSSAALLRLTIQKICVHLGLPGKNLNDDIGELVNAGLPLEIQQSLDIVRVVGNNQVHPGTLDVRDDPETATHLFDLINLIVEDRIARPNKIKALYQKLPEGARKQIEQRNAKSAATPKVAQ
ncbi:MAG: DUF4145 domain-containing protein [Candidatus Sulfotelmatobacter sp.]|jgi:hypothetical protein